MEKPVELTAEGVWNEVSGRLREALNENTFSTWFGEVEAVELSESAFVLTVPNNFTRDWIDGHFVDLISAAVGEIAGERGVRLKIRQSPAEEPPAPPIRRRDDSSGSLNAKYTFDSFVIGSSNRFAHAAALAVAEAPAQAYNPLFIYGGTGLGKTHLLQAIAQYVGEHSSGLTVRYVQ